MLNFFRDPYRRLFFFLETFFHETEQKRVPFGRITRYCISGATAAVTLFVCLALFRELFSFWYLFASTLAFAIAVVVSFLCQKYWTFHDHVQNQTKKQFILFLIISIFNLGANTVLMYLCVSIFTIYYLLAQIIVAACIAVWSFFVYKYIFNMQR